MEVMVLASSVAVGLQVKKMGCLSSSQLLAVPVAHHPVLDGEEEVQFVFLGADGLLEVKALARVSSY